jgi:hypothetical protein
MVTLDDRSTASPRGLTDEVRDCTTAVLAEVEATSQAILSASPGGPGAEAFLWVRITRLAAAADEAVDAAQRGELALLRAALRNFDTMAAAIWTVQDDVYARSAALN